MTHAAPKPDRSKLLASVATLVLLISGAILHLTLNPHPPGLDETPFRDLGRRLGQEAVQLQQSGSRIVLIARDTTQFQTPAYQAMADGVIEALKKAGTKPATIRTLKVDPLRVVGVPAGEYQELYRRLEDRDIIVSLLGPPLFEGASLASLGTRRPRVLAVCSGNLPRQADLKRLIEGGLLHTAVLHRPGAASSARTFDQVFQVVTAANTADLPVPASALP